MAEPRKVFRIEEMTAARLRPSVETVERGPHDADIMRELRELRAALAASVALRATSAAASSDASRLSSELNLIAGAIRGGNGAAHRAQPREADAAADTGGAASKAMPRIAHELNAIVEGSERATQKILTAAEEIDVTANNLSAALDGRIEQGLAQDIQDLVIKIFEACNFQDLIGQRVAKVLATLDFVEDHIARVLEEIKTASAGARRCGGNALYGPRLDGDPGHASQDEVDAMFGNRRAASGE
jgi:chemotaxis protein CheZ